jgi:hypothetical protein
MGEIQLPVPTSRGARTASGKLPAPKSVDDLPLATRLERKWRDRLIVATRCEGGWMCGGAMYKSLSGAAKAISGSHVSGPAFFNLRARKDGNR